ncbi:MAG TPA: right-handed parallel beta-helix repeat-containing protein [Chloroflexia bacterium]
MQRFRNSYFRTLMLVLTLLGSMLVGSWPAVAGPAPIKPVNPGTDQATSGTIVVSPSNQAGWRWMEEDTAAGGGMLVTGPATPPLGTGSAKLSVDGTGRFILSNLAYAGTRLADITNLAYSSYSEGASNILAPSLQFDIDYNLTDSNTAWQGRLIYEPYQDGSVITPGSWQTWSPMTGKWWASGAPGNGSCSQSTPCTWNQVLTAFPQAGLRAGNGWLHFKVGVWAGGFTGYVDGFTFGVPGNVTTYDFERPANVRVVGSGAGCPGAGYSTIQAAITAASAGDTIQVCPGSYNENVNINKNGITLVGAGASANPSYGTVIQGSTPTNLGGSPGISLPNGVIGVSIRNLRVQNFNANSGIYGALNNNNFTVDTVTVYNNNSTAGGNNGGIYMNGPVSNVTINNVTADSNRQRGIVIWNGFKQNITITNNTVVNNNCCGIELQDGSASGVNISGNVIMNNLDSGLAAIGLRSGAGPNVIANNVLVNNGRFGMEIKLPNGSGLETGDGSIVISGNTVARTVAIGAEARDIAGIAVYRRGWVAGNNNVDVPTGVIVKGNTVSGYQQPSTSDGFGIVVESLQTSVYSNTVSNNDVGIQRQAGHLPYTPNTAVDGDQSNQNDQYFGRGNSPAVCAQVYGNTFSGNTAATRDVGPVNALPCGNNAFAHLQPASPITVTAGSTFTLDLLVNGGTHSVRSQQSYLTFPRTLLQNIVVGSNGTASNAVSPDLTSFETVLQNQVCNGPTPCTFGSLTAPSGSIAYASSTFNASAPSGDFRVAQMAFSTNQIGDATVHWQFSPPDPANRNSQVNDTNNNVVSSPALYQDYVIHIVHAMFTGHVFWEGRQALYGQPDPHNMLPITLTLTMGNTAYNFTGLTTDASGNFSVAVDNLPNGTYTWRVKGPQYLSTSGTVVLNHDLATTVEMGLQPVGDANNDNLVDITDYGILYASFGRTPPDPLYDARADFNGDTLVDITDFTLMRGNFGRIGDQPGKPITAQKAGSAVLELRPQGKAPANGGTARVGDSFVLEVWVSAQPGTNVVAQQGYLSFPANQLRLGTSSKAGPIDGSTGLMPDGSVLDITLQNAICNGSAGCASNGMKAQAGTLSFASATFNATQSNTAFRIGQVTVHATSAGTARLHWQFSPSAPNTRNTKIMADNGLAVSQSGQFVDYVLNILPAGK